MTSSRYSKATALALLAVLVLSVAATPAAAVSVSKQTVPESAAVGDEVTATFTITNLYQKPSFESWNLTGSTELTNVTWTVSFRTPGGETAAKRSYDGQTFETPKISSNTDIDDDGSKEAITELRVTVRGNVPEVSEFTWPEKEQFTVATLVQTRGKAGSKNKIDSFSAHHYTTGAENKPGSKTAREELTQARQAIENASAAGGDVGEANSTFQTAVDFYELGKFEKAIKQANKAEKQAEAAEKQAKQSEQRSQMLLYGGIGLVVLLLVAGGVYYWRSQEEEYDKLG